MSYSNLIRLGGLAAILGAMLFVIADLTTPLVFDVEGDPGEAATSFGYHLLSLLLLVAGPLLLLGLVGLYLRGPEAMGIIGLVAFLITFYGSVLVQGAVWSEAFGIPSIATVAPEVLESDPPSPYLFGNIISFVLANVGWFLFGMAVLRSRLYPRLAALILIAVSLLLVVLNALPVGEPGGILMYVAILLDILFYAAVAWMGFVLLKGRGAATEQPSSRV